MFQIFSFLTRTKDSVASASDTTAVSELTVSNALKDSTVSGCIRIISELISQVGFTSDDEIFNNLIKKPNYINTQSEFLRVLVQNMLAYGRVFIEIVRDGSGKPIQLNILDNSEMTVGINSTQIPTYLYKYTSNATAKRIDFDNIIDIRDVPTTGVKSLSRIENNLTRISLLISADKLVESSFRNGLNLKYHVKFDKQLSVEKSKEMAVMFRDEFNANSGAGSNVFVSGNSDVTELNGTTPANADLRDFRKNLIGEVCAIFGVQPSLLGGTSDQKYSNVRQKTTALYRDTIVPLLINIQQRFEDKFDTVLHYDANVLLQGDFESSMRVATQGVSGGVMTVNEARSLLLLPLSDDLAYNTIQPPKTFESDDARGSVDEPNDLNPEANRDNNEGDEPEKED